MVVPVGFLFSNIHVVMAACLISSPSFLLGPWFSKDGAGFGCLRFPWVISDQPCSWFTFVAPPSPLTWFPGAAGSRVLSLVSTIVFDAWHGHLWGVVSIVRF